MVTNHNILQVHNINHAIHSRFENNQGSNAQSEELEEMLKQRDDAVADLSAQLEYTNQKLGYDYNKCGLVCVL